MFCVYILTYALTTNFSKIDTNKFVHIINIYLPISDGSVLIC